MEDGKGAKTRGCIVVIEKTGFDPGANAKAPGRKRENKKLTYPGFAVAAPSYPVDVPRRCAIPLLIPGSRNESSTGSRLTAPLPLTRFVLRRLLTAAGGGGRDR
jgi:hypothetical protein